MAEKSARAASDEPLSQEQALEFVSRVRDGLFWNKRNRILIQFIRDKLAEIEANPSGFTQADIDSVYEKVESARASEELFRLAKRGLGELIQIQIDHGVDLNAQDPRTGATALHYAAANAARPALRALIRSGLCDYLIRDHKGRLAWELASDAGDAAAARLLFAKARKQALAQGVPFERRLSSPV